MPLTRNPNLPITWPGGGVVGAGGSLSSDPFTIDVTAINVQAHMNATGTGGKVEFYLQQSADDAVYDGAEAEHSVQLGTIDLDIGSPRQITRKLAIPQSSCRLLAVNTGGTSATVTASYTEQRAS